MVLTSWLLLGIVSSLCGLIAGGCAALFTTWALKRFTIELEYRLADVEDRVTREVKKRAAEASNAKQKVDQTLEEWAKGQKNPSENSFTNWYKSKMVKG